MHCHIIMYMAIQKNKARLYGNLIITIIVKFLSKYIDRFGIVRNNDHWVKGVNIG